MVYCKINGHCSLLFADFLKRIEKEKVAGQEMGWERNKIDEGEERTSLEKKVRESEVGVTIPPTQYVPGLH